MANRKFAIAWYENPKYGNPIMRSNTVEVVNASPDIGAAAKAAVTMFSKSFGSLKKNTIVSIQEFDKDGRPVGEPIIPNDETEIVPTRK